MNATLFAKIVALLKLQNILTVFQIVGIPLAIYALFQTNHALQLQEESNRTARIGLAWANLNSSSPGNSGKARAMETLLDAGEPLAGLIVNCSAMKGEADPNSITKCKGSPVFDGILINKNLYFSNAELLEIVESQEWTAPINQRWDEVSFHRDLTWTAVGGLGLESFQFVDCKPNNTISNGEISNAVIYNIIVSCISINKQIMKNNQIIRGYFLRSILQDVSMQETIAETLYFDYSKLSNVDFSNSLLDSTGFDNSNLSTVNFQDSKLRFASFNNSVTRDVNVSGVDFCASGLATFDDNDPTVCAAGLTPEVLKGFWAYRSNPPKAVGPLANTLLGIELRDG